MARSTSFLFLLMCMVFSNSDGHVASVRPVIVSREEWGARTRIYAIRRLAENPPGYVIIHHSNTQPCETQSSCIAEVNNIQDQHMNDKLYHDIAYNFLVGGDGLVYEGRGWKLRGTHIESNNSKSIGICLIGTFSNTSPSVAQSEAAQNLIDWGVANNKISRNYKLLGHSQMADTVCPGNALYDHIKTWPHWSESP